VEEGEQPAACHLRDKPMHERAQLALEVLGGDRLTVRELYERVKAELPDEARIYETDVRYVVRLYAARALDRKGEHWRKGTGVRYRYFRRNIERPTADSESA
jgi:hypothetical protein